MRVLVFVFALLLSGAATAASKKYVDVKKVAPAEFAATADGVRDAIRNKKFVLERKEVAVVEERLGEMSSLLEGVSDIKELDDKQRVALFNAQEEVNAILTARAGDRKICEHRTRLGSHRKEVHCETVSERALRTTHTREKTRQMFGEAKLQCNDAGCL